MSEHVIKVLLVDEKKWTDAWSAKLRGHDVGIETYAVHTTKSALRVPFLKAFSAIVIGLDSQDKGIALLEKIVALNYPGPVIACATTPFDRIHQCEHGCRHQVSHKERVPDVLIENILYETRLADEIKAIQDRITQVKSWPKRSLLLAPPDVSCRALA